MKAKLPHLCIAVAGALILSGCSGMELKRTDGITPTGSAFGRALFSEYVAYSRTEFNEGDYENSDVFALRARSVAQGTVLEPEEMATRTLPPATVPELTTARGRLVAALRGGARERAPQDAAKAQVMWECWMEEQEENNSANDIATCRTAFLAALAKIEQTPVAAQAETITVYFDTDKATLNDEARREVARAVARIRALNAKSVVLEGHADRTGSAGHNMSLSQNRVAAVRAAIQQAGVNVQFSESAFGETRPAVPTAEGVRERRNRGVAVKIVP